MIRLVPSVALALVVHLAPSLILALGLNLAYMAFRRDFALTRTTTRTSPQT